jgi:hypothetical protein
MKEEKFSEDEIQILGNRKKSFETSRRLRTAQERRRQGCQGRKRNNIMWLFSFVTIFFVLIACVIIYFCRDNFYSGNLQSVSVQLNTPALQDSVSSKGYIEIVIDTINDIPLVFYTPHNAFPKLCVGLPDENALFATAAADIGKNNYGIVGDFVLASEQLARGVRRDGYCAIIDNTVTIGFGEKTPLLQESIDKKGYFFRHYALVKNYKHIDNTPKGEEIRRALAVRNGRIIIVSSLQRESFHDFAQALSDADISDAICLVCGNDFYGWCHTHGNSNYGSGSDFVSGSVAKIGDVSAKPNKITWGEKKAQQPTGINYLVWVDDRE